MTFSSTTRLVLSNPSVANVILPPTMMMVVMVMVMVLMTKVFTYRLVFLEFFITNLIKDKSSNLPAKLPCLFSCFWSRAYSWLFDVGVILCGLMSGDQILAFISMPFMAISAARKFHMNPLVFTAGTPAVCNMVSMDIDSMMEGICTWARVFIGLPLLIRGFFAITIRWNILVVI